MTTDRVFVLLMMILLMMAGCFEATSTTEAEEEQDSTTGNDGTSDNVPSGDSGEDSSSNEPVDSSGGQGSGATNSGTSTSNSQERTWYSSGNGIITNWNDGQDTYSQQRCLEYGPSYDSNTGEYIGEECKRSGYPQSEQDWNSSSCDGVLIPLNGWYSTACKSTVKTINTNPGEALLIYELQEVSVTTICNGITASTISSANILNLDKEYRIAAGSALSCVHEITYMQYYSSLSEYDPNEMEIWSIVYALQDTVVV